MPTDPKSRMVSFRLSIEEYERIRGLSFSHGLGSISELARKAIHLLLQNPVGVPSQSLEIRVADLEGRMNLLASDLRKLENRAFEKEGLR